jgi:cysteinyl-tRNA synthetase
MHADRQGRRRIVLRRLRRRLIVAASIAAFSGSVAAQTLLPSTDEPSKLGAQPPRAPAAPEPEGPISGWTGTVTVEPGTPAQERQNVLAQVRNWGYQLRLMRAPQIAASPFDLVVIDHALSEGGRHVAAFGPELLRAMKTKPDGSRRVVLAYLSIGEAETYRYYWQPAWSENRPNWLGGLNPQWEGNYTVRYWDADWQRIILGGPNSYLERIKAAGFDGVYLDRGDIFQEFSGSRPQAAQEMAAFIGRIAEVARRDMPQFLVVMQNAEELLEDPTVLNAIDGIAKEDLYTGENHDGRPNDAGTIAATLSNLRLAKRAGKRVLVVEYVDDAATSGALRRRAESQGFVIHFAKRDLSSLRVTAPDEGR